MTDDLAIIVNLELAIARASAERRSEMVLQMTELFVQGAARFAESQISVFDEVILRIARYADPTTLANMSQCLVPITNAPPGVMRFLANEDEIAVAYPVLAHSDRLDQHTIVNCARTKSQKHLLAISWRRSLSVAVTDVLLERGNRHVILTTARNAGARFSEAGLEGLVARCDSDTILAAVLGSRPDIFTLLITGSESIRTRLIAKSSHVRHEIDRVFAMITDIVQDVSIPEPVNNTDQSSEQLESPRLLQDDFLVSAKEPIERGNDESNDDLMAVEEVVLPTLPITTMSDRRHVKRIKSFLRGRVFFNSRNNSLDCMIRDVSKQGARILVSADVGIPDKVELYIPQKNASYDARVEWRRQDEIGLVFPVCVEGRDMPPPADLSERVSSLEEEIAALRRLAARQNEKLAAVLQGSQSAMG
jgi:hypothetical protein